ncbi:MAG: chromate efflux transporter [Tissierella sp.]|uniref:chromate efflux transporter n=1 Tax=Tissierella sp. TaxID=41274 RepID=UPI003F9AED25
MKREGFLKDIFICSLGAFGGPEAHYGVITDQLVIKKEYLDEKELVELIALCTMLPGPTSTQTIVSIGYKVGGPKLAFLTMLVWALPVIVLMTMLSFLYKFLDSVNLSHDILRYIGPMAVGFIIVAAYRIGKKVIVDKMTFFLLLFGGVTTYFFRKSIVFPIVLIIGGVVSIVFSKEKDLWNRVRLNPPWIYFLIFLIFAGGSIALSFLFNNIIINLFESFYKYGYLVFGGGQTVVPLMITELVDIKGYMTSGEFLTGYGLVQGLPGPMFSFSAYAGGMAARGNYIVQIIGSLVSSIAIFLPGLLLIYFIYPIWENLKSIKGIKISLKGINAVAGGLIAASAFSLMQKNGFAIDNILIVIFTSLLLFTKKLPAPVIVVIVLVIGFLF